MRTIHILSVIGALNYAIEAKLPSLPKFKASWSSMRKPGSEMEAIASDLDEYYDDDESDDGRVAALGGAAVKLVASSCMTAACVWAGRRFNAPPAARKPFGNPFGKPFGRSPPTSPAADEGPVDEKVLKAMGKAMGGNKAPKPVDAPAAPTAPVTPKKAPVAVATATTEAAAPPVAVAVVKPSTPKLKGIEKVLGPTLLRATKNGTRLEVVATREALGLVAAAKSPVPSVAVVDGENTTNATTNTTTTTTNITTTTTSGSGGVVVGLYVSSAALERELKSRQLTRKLLSSHVEEVRQQCARDGKALELVYVSLDEDARDFRDMVRSMRHSGSGDDDGSTNDGEGGAWSAVSGFGDEEAPPESATSQQEATGSLIRKSLLDRFATIGEVPTLALLDGKTGKVLNSAALGSVLSKPDGYPWPPKSLQQILFGGGDDEDDDEDDGKGGEGAPKSILLPPTAEKSGAGSDAVTAATALGGKKYIGLYFSASWCAPCKQFTPLLAQTRAAILKRSAGVGQDDDPTTDDGQFEVLFVSHDRDKDSFERYRTGGQKQQQQEESKRVKGAEEEEEEGETGAAAAAAAGAGTGAGAEAGVSSSKSGVAMPWPSVAFDSSLRTELQRVLSVTSLPTLIVLEVVGGQELKVVCAEGRGALLGDPAGLSFPWPPQPVAELGNPPPPPPLSSASLTTPAPPPPASLGGLLEGKALVLLADKCGSSSSSATTAAASTSTSSKLSGKRGKVGGERARGKAEAAAAEAAATVERVKLRESARAALESVARKAKGMVAAASGSAGLVLSPAAEGDEEEEEEDEEGGGGVMEGVAFFSACFPSDIVSGVRELCGLLTPAEAVAAAKAAGLEDGGDDDGLFGGGGGGALLFDDLEPGPLGSGGAFGGGGGGAAVGEAAAVVPEAPRLLLLDYPNHVFYERELGAGNGGPKELEAEMAAFVASAVAGELASKPLVV